MEKRHSLNMANVFYSTLAVGSFVLFTQFSLSGMETEQAGPTPPPPTAEVPTQTQQPSAPSPEASTSTGPDTVDAIEKTGIQGNWVKKREWLMQSTTVNNQIQELAAQNEPIRKSFIEKYQQAQTILDGYYNTHGLQQGQLQELFDSISRYLDKKRHKELSPLGIPTGEKQDPELQAKIDTIESSIKDSKHQLEQLKLDMKSVEDLDRSIHDRFKRLDEYCNTIQEDANRAKAIVNDLWNVVDHNIARDRYYELNNNILEKIKNTQSFLQNEFVKDFESVIATINTQISKTDGTVKTLEAKGFIIKNRTQRIKEIKLKELRKEGEPQESVKEAAPVKKPVRPPTVFERVSNAVGTIINKLSDAWQWIKTRATGLWAQWQGTTPTAKAPAPTVSQQPQQPATTLPTTTPPAQPGATTPVPVVMPAQQTPATMPVN